MYFSVPARPLPNPVPVPRPVPRRPPGMDIDLEAEDDIMSQYAGKPMEEESLHPLASGVLDTCYISVCQSFPIEDRETAVRVVRENGGTVVQPQDADYHLGPLQAKTGGAGPEKGVAVTMIWLVSC